MPLVGLTFTGLALAILLSLACHPADSRRELSKVDGELLAQIDRLLEPIPRFSGSSGDGARFRPIASGQCPPAQVRAVLPALSAASRRQLVTLGRDVARLTGMHGDEPAVLRLRALWTLLADSTAEGRERAIRLLREALARKPGSMQRRNDLAAAYLLRASLDGQTVALAAALELLDEADPHPPAVVLRNRAYAFQCLTLWQDAEDTWRQLAKTAGE